MTAQDFDLSVVAGLYSTLSGVLAGFAFTALVVLVTQASPGPVGPDVQSRRRASGLLLAAFVGLGVSSLTYAVIAGDSNSARLAVSHLMAGSGFAAAALLLFMGVNELVRSTHPAWVELLTARLVPGLMVIYLFGGCVLVRNRAGSDIPLVFWLAVLLLVAFVSFRLPFLGPARASLAALAMLGALAPTLSAAAVMLYVSLYDASAQRVTVWPVILVGLPTAALVVGIVMGVDRPRAAR